VDIDMSDDRREFIKKCGKFAAVTPPAVTFLLSTTMSSNAIAKSGSGRPTPGATHNEHGNNGRHLGWSKKGGPKSS